MKAIILLMGQINYLRLQTDLPAIFQIVVPTAYVLYS